MRPQVHKGCAKGGTRSRIISERNEGLYYFGQAQCLSCGALFTYGYSITREEARAIRKAKLDAIDCQKKSKRLSGVCKNESGDRNKPHKKVKK